MPFLRNFMLVDIAITSYSFNILRAIKYPFDGLLKKKKPFAAKKNS